MTKIEKPVHLTVLGEIACDDPSAKRTHPARSNEYRTSESSSFVRIVIVGKQMLCVVSAEMLLEERRHGMQPPP
jgi:hypothetical protein